MTLAPWFERRFDFSSPIESHPVVRVRLRGAPARLEELTHGLSTDVLTTRRDDSWSIQENAGHLFDLEPLWMVRVEELLAGTDRMRAADLTNRRTHEARYNERRLDDILMAFRGARMALVERLEALSPADYARTALHPRLQQPMRLLDHLIFVADHDDHHLARIWELRGSQI